MRIPAGMLATSLPLFAQGPIKWEHDLATAQQRARKEGRPLFVYIWAGWCPPCQDLKSTIFPSMDAQEAPAASVP